MSITREVLSKYVTRIFVETGTCNGDGSLRALECGFNEIRTVENDKRKITVSRNRFKNFNQIKLYEGKSIDLLPIMIEDIDEPVTFWLDAHGSRKGYQNAIEEVKVIAQHPIKTHNILIDDMRFFRRGNILDTLINAVKSINSDYNIFFENGFWYSRKKALKDDILVAIVKNKGLL